MMAIAMNNKIDRSRIQHGLPSDLRRLRKEQMERNKAILEMQKIEEGGEVPPPRNSSINWDYAEQNYGATAVGVKVKEELEDGDWKDEEYEHRGNRSYQASGYAASYFK